MRNNVAVGFAPWVVFWFVAAPSSWKWAALAALVVSIGFALPGFVRDRSGRRPGISALDATGLVFFLVLTVLAFSVLNREDLASLEDYAQALSMGLLAVVAFGGLLVNRPFTAYYAKASVPEQYWGSAEFRRINRVVTLVWAVAFAVIAVAGFVAVRYEIFYDLLQWVVPIVVLLAASRFTQVYTADDDSGPAATTPDAPESASRT